MAILYAGCWFSVVMDEFGCARSDPGFEPHGTDPLHGLSGFVFAVTSVGILGATLTRRWLVVAVETVLMCWFGYYLFSHTNDPNWCHLG
jgi:hypothetical protein